MKIRHLIYFFGILLVLLLVFFKLATSDKSLGSGYILFDEGFFTQIINGNGGKIVPPVVTHYAYDRHHIIAISQDIDTQEIKYWIIDKDIPIDLSVCKDFDTRCFDSIRQLSVEGPLDSDTFYRLLESKEIELRFDD